MNWYKEQIEKEMNNLEPRIRQMYLFIKREDTPEDLREMAQDAFNKMKWQYNELKRKLEMI